MRKMTLTLMVASIVSERILFCQSKSSIKEAIQRAKKDDPIWHSRVKIIRIKQLPKSSFKRGLAFKDVSRQELVESGKRGEMLIEHFSKMSLG